MTTVLPEKSERETLFPLSSVELKLGALVPADSAMLFRGYGSIWAGRLKRFSSKDFLGLRTYLSLGAIASVDFSKAAPISGIFAQPFGAN